jgi:uncharacterized protein YegJ (DUF2314 family)
MLHRFVVTIEDEYDLIDTNVIVGTNITVEDDDPDYDVLESNTPFGEYHVMASTKEDAIEEAEHLRSIGIWCY